MSRIKAVTVAFFSFRNKGVKNIRLMCIIAAPEGVKKMQEDHPDVDVYIGALDDHLNELAYLYISNDSSLT